MLRDPPIRGGAAFSRPSERFRGATTRDSGAEAARYRTAGAAPAPVPARHRALSLHRLSQPVPVGGAVAVHRAGVLHGSRVEAGKSPEAAGSAPEALSRPDDKLARVEGHLRE